MPVEVRELIIKAIVEQEGGGTGTASPDNAVSSQDETIKLCVEKVLEILEDRDER